MNNAKCLTFITNNIKGIRNNSKRLSVVEYFRNKLGNNGILFLQETHSTFNDKIIWKNDFNGPVFYSHGTSQSCGVFIAYFGNLNFSVNKQVGDKNGRILTLDVNIDEIRYVPDNIYNANNKVEQVQVLSKLSELMKNINFSEENRIVLAGDLNVFFDSKLEMKGGKPSLKQKSVAKLLELKEEYNLYDIWRIRNPTKKLYTFRQNHSSGIINRRLDYIFISNKLQEFSNDTNIIPAFKTDHSSVSVTISNYNFFKPGPGLWKFNNSLINDETFTNTFKNFIQNMINELELNTKTFLDNQLKWELLKYEIRRFTISYCKQPNKKDVAERKYLENKFKNLEDVLDNYDNLESYHNIKNKIEEIYEKKAEGARIRSKCL